MNSRSTCAISLFMAAATACGGGGDGGTNPPPVPVVTSVDVTPATGSVVVGDTLRVSALVKDQNGQAMQRTIVWSSTATTVATVAATGTVTAVAAGQASIVATVEGRTGSMTVTVSPPPLVVTTVEVSPATRVLAIGDTTRFAATVKDQHGAAMTGRPVTWTSSAPSVATVSAAGLVTAVLPGAVVIAGSVEGKTGTANVTVRAPIASLTVSPDSATVPVGSTLTLQATARDASGATLTGRAITWSTLDATVATVSNAGIVTAVKLGTARIVASGEGKADTAVVRVPAGPLAIVMEAAQAGTVSLGVAGGSFSVTSAAGVKYTLTVPPSALRVTTAITMTPIGAVGSLPVSGGFVAGVDFAPSGLRFARAATLTIETSRKPSAGQVPVGLSYQNTSTAPTLTLARLTASGLEVPVTHFSGVVAGFGTSQDLFALLAAFDVANTTHDFYVNGLMTAASASPPDYAFAYQVLEDWFDDLVLPSLPPATTDATLVSALSIGEEWMVWAQVLAGVSPEPASIATRRQQWSSAIAVKIRSAITANKLLCDDPGRITAFRLAALDAAVFWQYRAEVDGLATSANGLTRAAFRQGLCATVVATQTTLASPLLEGAQASLDAMFGLRLSGTSGASASNFYVLATASGAQLDRAGGNTALAPAGLYSTIVTPSAGTSAATILFDVCYENLTLAQNPQLSRLLCGTSSVTRSVIPNALTWGFTNNLEGWSPINNVIQRSNVDGRQVARLDNGSAMTRAVALPATAATLELVISAHNHPSSAATWSVSVTGQSGNATIISLTTFAPSGGGYAWSTVTGNLALFAGQTVTIRITQQDQNHGQLYIDSIRVR